MKLDRVLATAQQGVGDVRLDRPRETHEAIRVEQRKLDRTIRDGTQVPRTEVVTWGRMGFA